MKKYLISLLLCFSIILPILPQAEAATLPEITSAGFVLCNAASGEILESKNPQQRLYPASLTKLMTALLTLELAQDLDTEQVTVSKNAVESLAGTHSSVGNLLSGETYTLRQLLYLLMIPSGNDAANVLAEYFCTTNAQFAEKMNAKAAELGLQNTHFVNPHGLHDPNHYTTAQDTALLTLAFLREPVLREIASATEYTVPATSRQPERTVKTTNLMKLSDSGYYYPAVYGLKTGNTDEAGRCLIATAEKDGLDLICVLMNCPAKYTATSVIRCEFLEAAAVFNYAFEQYTYQKLFAKNQHIGTKTVANTFRKSVDLVLADDVYATIPKGTDPAELQQTVQWNTDGAAVKAPVEKGHVMGVANITCNGKRIAQADVVAAQTVDANPLIVFWQKADIYIYLVLGVLAALLLLFFALVVRARILRRKRRRRKASR